jgi:hypothetical protein
MFFYVPSVMRPYGFGAVFPRWITATCAAYRCTRPPPVSGLDRSKFLACHGRRCVDRGWGISGSRYDRTVSGEALDGSAARMVEARCGEAAERAAHASDTAKMRAVIGFTSRLPIRSTGLGRGGNTQAAHTRRSRLSPPVPAPDLPRPLQGRDSPELGSI